MKCVGVYFFILILILTSWNSFAGNEEALVVKRIQKIAANCHCEVGVAAMRIETHKKIAYQGNTPFFMASTVKLPIAVALLRRVDRQEERLDRLIEFNQNCSVPGSGRLFDELSLHPRTHFMSLKQLLRLMLVISDNTASDIILKEVRGPRAVSSELKKLGYKHISVDRCLFDIYMSSSGVTDHFPDLHSINKLNRFLDKINPEKKVLAWKKFQCDLRDTATPNEMVSLLASLYQEQVLSSKSTHLLLEYMEQCQTGKQRIKGLLPPCAKVAHKTGTWTIFQDKFVNYKGSKQLYRFANDVGIITLPHNKGHIAIAIYVKSKATQNNEREKAISRISRIAYDYFVASSN